MVLFYGLMFSELYGHVFVYAKLYVFILRSCQYVTTHALLIGRKFI